MKKALSMILVLTMVLALALPAMAAEGQITEGIPGAASQDVTASYTKPIATDAGTKYYVTIAWKNTDKNLTYTSEKATYTLDGNTLQYGKTVNREAGWSGKATWQITVTNQSNADIEFVTTPTTTYDSLKFTTASTTTVTTAAVSETNGSPIVYTDTATKGKAQSKTAIVSYEPGGAGTTVPTGTEDNNSLSVGTITVKVQGKTTGNT